MRAVIGIGIEEEDRKHTWMEDADSVSAAPWAGARGAAGGPVGWGSGGGRWPCGLGTGHLLAPLQPGGAVSSAPVYEHSACVGAY